MAEPTLKKRSGLFPDDVVQRFLSYVDVDESSGAWIWTGGKTGSGYGGFWFDGRTVLAHRFAYEAIYGAIPDGMFVCHKDESLGRHNVNPDHMFLGSATDNMRDASRKGRTLAGEQNRQSVLAADQVREILKSKESQAALARRYGVSCAKISQIKRGTAWTHLSDAPAPVSTHSLRNKSGYRGVSWHPRAKKWRAGITVTTLGRKFTYDLGYFVDPVDAAKAFDAAALKYRGAKANLNFPQT